MRRRAPSIAAVLALVACGHSEPYAVVPPDAVGPFTSTFPRRLTFNPLGDITPSVVGDTLVFSRREPHRPDRDRCLALLPVEGGRLHRTSCARGALADSVRDVWIYPTVSPDRQRVAFVRERYRLVPGFLLDRAIVVAALSAPDSGSVVATGAYRLPDGGLGDGFRHLTWVDDATLRFLGGIERIGGGAVEGFVPAGVFELSVSGSEPTEPRIVAELADALAYAPGTDGETFFRRAGDPFGVWRVAPGSPAAEAARFESLDTAVLQSVADIALVGDALVAIATFVYPEGATVDLLVRRALAGGPQEVESVAFTPQRLVGVPGRDLVVVEAAGDLWLVAAR
jgi:hypothetical protein